MCEETNDFVHCPGNSQVMTDYNCCGVKYAPCRDTPDCEVPPPELKRSKLSLAKKKPLPPTNTTVTEEEIEKFSRGCIPAGTAKSTSWAFRTFQQ